MTAVRPCDRASALILAWQDELTALGLLPPGAGRSVRRGRPATVKFAPLSPQSRELREQARKRAARLAAAEASAAEHYARLEAGRRAS